MDRNTFIGLILIGAIIIGFSIFNAPSEAEIAAQKRRADSIARVEAEENKIAAERAAIEKREAEVLKTPETTSSVDTLVSVNDSIQDQQALSLYGPFAKAAAKQEQEFMVETELLQLTFSSKGGRIKEAILKDYLTYDQEPLVLFDSTTKFNLNFFTRDNKNIYTDELNFSADFDDIRISGEDQRKLTFTLEVSDEQYIEYIYTIKGNDYLIDFDINLVGMDQLVDMRSGELYLNWVMNTPNQEKSLKQQRDATNIYYKYKGEDVDDLGAMSDEKEDYEASIKWVSFKQQFFNMALIADETFDKSRGFMQTETDEGTTEYVKTLTTALTIPLSGNRVENFGMGMYIGPNHYKTLKSYDADLEEIIDLGWGIFGWVNQIAVIPVFNYLDHFDLSYGIIILILTILLKLVLSPITYKTYMSGAKMRVLKPEINEINEKHKDDAMKKQQAMMGLYKQTGVNPLSGCIPLLIQMPILIAMFRFFPASIELRQESFLWADDLSTYDSIYNFPDGFSIPWYGDHVSLFTLLMAVSIMFYTKINSSMSMTATQEGPMAQQMKIMMYIMPVMMLFFFNSYSSGLSYYYFLANIISILQTLLIRKVFINEDAIRAKIEKNKKKPKSKKKSGFQKRLEEMAKQKGIEPPKR